MKKSKLDPYREFILNALPSNSISRIRRDLARKGCPVSRSRLSDWIQEIASETGIEIPTRKRGRTKSKPALFAFLPPEGEELGPGKIPLFLIALEEMSAQMRRSTRDTALEQLGLPKYGSPPPDEPSEVERLANLTDVELCLLTLLLSNLPAPPLSKGRDELTAWFTKLVKCACKLRLTIRAASERRTA